MNGAKVVVGRQVPRGNATVISTASKDGRKRNTASAGEQTRAAILKAAEKLFAEQGPEAASIRAIATEANVNLAAVNYHFGTKEKLFEELFHRLVTPINEQRIALLDECLYASGGKAPSIERIMNAFIAPPLSLLEEDAGSARALVVMQFLSQSFSKPGEADFLETYYEPVRTRFIGILRTALPQLTLEDVLWRYNYVVGAIIYAMGGSERMTRVPRLVGQHGAPQIPAHTARSSSW